MKSAEQWADEIFKELDCDQCCGPMHKESMAIFTKALTAYAEEQLKENLEKCATYHCESCHQDQDEYGFSRDECSPGCCCENVRQIGKARIEALEEAAKVAETSHKNVDCIHIAFRIRALKDGKGKA